MTEAALYISNWLSGCESRDLDDAGLVAGLGEQLVLAGVPLHRLALHIRMPHPELAGLTIAWAPGEAVEIHERAYDFLKTPDFLGSPLRVVMDTRRPMHVRLNTAEGARWTHIDVFQQRGLVEHFIVSLGNLEGPSAATFCTVDKTGFSKAHCRIIKDIVPALCGAFEVRVLGRVKRVLLDTYVGSNTAQRILAGQIRRGIVDTMETALMLCDLRGFTALSNRLPHTRVLEILDIYFDSVVPTIVEAGGEVLKFAGDSVLAYFPARSAHQAANAALKSAETALARLSQIRLPDTSLTAGIALHYGRVGYGNIGAAGRLDFTVVGRDVNLLSRIQNVCAEFDCPILFSQDFAAFLESGQVTSMGWHRLKGFAERIELYALKGDLHQMSTTVAQPATQA